MRLIYKTVLASCFHSAVYHEIVNINIKGIKTSKMKAKLLHI